MDITLGGGTTHGGFSDGNTIWIIDDTNNEAIAYDARTIAAQPQFDFNLGNRQLRGGTNVGDILFAVDNSANQAVAFRAPLSTFMGWR